VKIGFRLLLELGAAMWWGAAVLQMQQQGLTANSGIIVENTESHRCLMF